jgi:putative endonuclease
MHYVYILRSGADGGYYYGSTSDLQKRIKEHNSGRVKSTRSRRPMILHYHEEFADKAEALKRERYFKKRSGYRWLKSRGLI